MEIFAGKSPALLSTGPSLCLSHLSGQGISMQIGLAESSADLTFRANTVTYSRSSRIWHQDLSGVISETSRAQHALL